MSEITFETGQLPKCVDCQIKHVVDLKAHIDPELEPEKFKTVDKLAKQIGSELMMTESELIDFEKIREIEHKIEDYLTVLRDMRHKIQDLSYKRFEEASKKIEPSRSPLEIKEASKKIEASNPDERVGIGKLMEICEFTKELVKPKEYFDPKSFRILCPECPEARCSLCPPELACATRIVIGCKAGEWDAVAERCKIGTETHVIYHGKPKP
jgi:hypothetical protein